MHIRKQTKPICVISTFQSDVLKVKLYHSAIRTHALHHMDTFNLSRENVCLYYIKIHIVDHIFYLAGPNLIWQVTPWPIFGITLKMFRKNLPLYFAYLEQSSWTLWRAHLQNMYNSLHFLYFMPYLSFSSKTCSTDYAYIS